jgi:hypothetical protein
MLKKTQTDSVAPDPSPIQTLTVGSRFKLDQPHISKDMRVAGLEYNYSPPPVRIFT